MEEGSKKEVEEAVIERAKAGERDAMEQIVVCYQQRVFNLCYGTLLGRKDTIEKAQEAAQETFLRAWRGIRGFKGKSRLSTWLYRIAVNVCKDMLKRSSRPSIVPASDMEGPDGDELPVIEDFPDPGSPDPVDIVSERETRDAIQTCISRLNERKKQIVYLVYFSGHTYKETALALACPEGTVKSSLYRALGELRQCLKSLLRREDAL